MRIRLISSKKWLLTIGAVIVASLLLSLPGIAFAGSGPSAGGFYQQTNLISSALLYRRS